MSGWRKYNSSGNEISSYYVPEGSISIVDLDPDAASLYSYSAKVYLANSGAPTQNSISASQRLGSGGGTATWTTEFDIRPAGVSAQITASGGITIRKTGLYFVDGTVTLANVNSGLIAFCSIRKNGTIIKNGWLRPGSAGEVGENMSALVSLTSGEELSLYCYQQESASEAYAVSASYNNAISAKYVGPAS